MNQTLTFFSELGGGKWAVALLILGLVMAAMAVIWELRHCDPMINLGLFANSGFAGGNVLTFLVWACVGSNTFFVPMLMIVAWKLPPIYVGGVFLPFSIMIAILSPASGRLVDRYGTRLFLTLGPVVVGVAFMALGWAVVKTGILARRPASDNADRNWHGFDGIADFNGRHERRRQQ